YAAPSPKPLAPLTATLSPSDGERGKASSRAESVTQEIRVEEKFALARAKIRWQAEKGQGLPLLFEPAVLTRASYPSNSVALEQSTGPKRTQQLLARKSGTFDIEIQYELEVTKRDNEVGFILPVAYALVNRVRLTVVNLDTDVVSPQAVEIQRNSEG